MSNTARKQLDDQVYATLESSSLQADDAASIALCARTLGITEAVLKSSIDRLVESERITYCRIIDYTFFITTEQLRRDLARNL